MHTLVSDTPISRFTISIGPYEAARKMSQIQAVLARRCASIGEIQQQLWRADWQKGVANWGMLGTLTGGEWVSVVGGDGGTMDDMGFSKRATSKGMRSIQIFDHPQLVGSNVTNAPGESQHDNCFILSWVPLNLYQITFRWTHCN